MGLDQYYFIVCCASVIASVMGRELMHMQWVSFLVLSISSFSTAPNMEYGCSYIHVHV